MTDDTGLSPEELERISLENKRLWDATAGITFAWANIENSMVMLLTAIFNENHTRPISYASAVYFAPSNIETRIKIVDRALCEFIYEHGLIDLTDEWRAFLKNLNHLKGTRNKVAHGHISCLSSKGGKNNYRLTAPLFDMQKARDSYKNRQLPGFSANDLEISLKATHDVDQRIVKFTELVKFIHAGDVLSYSKKFSELKTSHKTLPLNKATGLV